MENEFAKQLEFEIVKKDEVKEVMALYKEVIKTTLTTWNKNYPAKDLIKEDIQNKDLFCLKDKTKKIIAVAYISNQFEDEEYKCGEKFVNPYRFARICTHPDYQHMGVGTRMMEEILKVAKTNNSDGFKISVYKKNEAAIKLYKKFGFVQIGEKKNYYGYDYFIFELKL